MENPGNPITFTHYKPHCPPHLLPRCFCLIFLTSPSLDPRLCWNPVRTFKRFSNEVARRWSFSKAYILPQPGLGMSNYVMAIRGGHDLRIACLIDLVLLRPGRITGGSCKKQVITENVHPKSVFKLGVTVYRIPSLMMPKMWRIFHSASSAMLILVTSISTKWRLPFQPPKGILIHFLSHMFPFQQISITISLFGC